MLLAAVNEGADDAAARMSTKRKRSDSSSPAMTDSTPTSSIPERASLLGLPRELRDEIWTMALRIYPKSQSGPPNIIMISKAENQPGLLRANQHIRREAQAVYYKAFVLEATSETILSWWLRRFLPGFQVDRVSVLFHMAQRLLVAGPRNDVDKLRGIVWSTNLPVKVEVTVLFHAKGKVVPKKYWFCLSGNAPPKEPAHQAAKLLSGVQFHEAL